jgi:hypothetical protein
MGTDISAMAKSGNFQQKNCPFQLIRRGEESMDHGVGLDADMVKDVDIGQQGEAEVSIQLQNLLHCLP